MIELANVSIAYGREAVLEKVTTTFPDHTFTCIVGPNGSGKSTLLRALAGLQPYSGSIRLSGRELCGLTRAERAALLAYLPQSRPVPDIDARTLIAHGRFPHLGFSKHLTRADWELVDRAASSTGATSLLERKLTELSGGERQRVYLAMVVAQDAQVILLDEPATYLDIRHQVELFTLLKGLYDQGRSVIMVAHDLPGAFSCAGEVKLMDRGTLTAQGPPKAMCEAKALQEAFGVRLQKDDRPDSLFRYRVARIESVRGF